MFGLGFDYVTPNRTTLNVSRPRLKRRSTQLNLVEGTELQENSEHLSSAVAINFLFKFEYPVFDERSQIIYYSQFP